MRRWLAGLFLYVVIAAATVLLLATETGLRWAWTLASPTFAPGLTLTDIQGRLIGPIRLQGLRYRDQDQRLDVRMVEWDWQAWRLLGGVLDVTRLHAEGLHYSALIAGTGWPSLPDSLQPPLELQLRQVLLQDIQYVDAPGAAPILIEELGFRASDGLLGLHIDKIQLRAGDLNAGGEGRVRLRGDYAIKARLHGQRTMASGSSWQGTVDMQGSLRKLDLKLALLAPQPAQLSGQMRWIGKQLELDAKLGTPALAEWLRWLELPSGDARELQGTLRARLQAQQLELERAEFGIKDEAVKVRLAGTADLGMDLTQANLQIQWQDIRWPLQPEAWLQSPTGQLQFRGNAEDYILEVSAAVQAAGVAAEAIQLRATGGRKQLQFEAFQAQVAGGSLSGRGQLDWSQVTTLALELAGNNINPAIAYPEWPGNLSFESKSTAQWPERGLQLHLEQLAARGQLRGRALALSSRARWSEAGWDIEHARLRTGGSQLSVQGRYGEDSDLSAEFDSPDLADFLPQASGRLQGNVKWRGSVSSPRLSANLRGRDLHYASDRLGSLSLDAQVDGRANGKLQLNAQLQNSQVSGVDVQALELTATGSKAAHATRVQVISELGELELQGTGQWMGGLAWQANWQSSELRPSGAGRWLMTEPAQWQVSQTQATLGISCWVGGESRACLQGRWSPTATTAKAEVRELPAAMLKPFLPADYSVTGLLDAEVSIEQPAGAAMTATAVTRYGGGELRRRYPGAGDLQVQFKASRAEVRIANNIMDIDGALNLLPAGQVAMTLQGPWPLTDEVRGQPLQGRVRADLPQLGFLSALLPELDEVSGQARGELQLSGTVAEPRASGSLEISEAGLRVDRLGLRVEALSAQLQSKGTGGLRLEASARSGGGDLVLKASSQGGLDLTGIRATLQGRDVLAYNNADARVYLSPDLTLAVQGREVRINGSLHIPRADITPREYAQTGAVTSSPDEVIIGVEDQPGSGLPGWSVFSRVQLTLGKEVRFNGLGLKALLAGELELQDEPGELTTATGELRVVEGQYMAYGQALDITNGRLLFNGGPVMDPAVDVKAERKPAENVLVGIQLRGLLKSPQVSLYSDPAMSDSQRLSYLMFGTPMDSGDGSRNAAIAQAAYTLGAAGSGGLIQKIGTQLGADEVKIQSSPGAGLGGSRLVIDKDLSPKLYVSYGIGMFNAVRTLRMRYKLSRRWTLETESGEHSGGDLLYSIER